MKLFSEYESLRAEQASPEVERELAQVRLNLGDVKSVVAFASAKGGVGKSAILINVAAALALKGRKVALLDADLNSPSVAAMLGMKRVKVFSGSDGIDPASGPLGLRVIASDLLSASEPVPFSVTEEESPAITNGARPVELTRTQMLRRLFGHTRFGAPDFLLIDVAPGLAEMDLIARIAPLTGIVLMSHPTGLGVQAAKAALQVAAQAGAPILGIVENMTGFFCGNCHSVRPLLPQGEMGTLVRDKGPAIISRLAFDPRLAETCDHGTQFVKDYAESPLAKQLSEIAARLEELIAAQPRRDQV